MRTFKRLISSIILIAIFGLFTAILPNALAISMPIEVYYCYSEVIIDFDNDAANMPLLPIDRTINIPISLNYFVHGKYDEIIPPYYADRNFDNFVYLHVEDKPDWCNATISPSFLQIPALANGTIKIANLTIKIDENAQAFIPGFITLKIRVTDMGPIIGDTFYTKIKFTPGYFPLLRINISDEMVRLIEPLETTNFEIDIENLGNDKTVVKSKIVDIPEGWTVTIDSNTTIGTGTSLGDNPKKTISLDVQPSIDFGYRNERKVIQVSLTPTSFTDQSISGQEYLVSFLIQSRGVSTPGFEASIALFALIIIVLCNFLWKKNKGKIKTNNKEENNR